MYNNKFDNIIADKFNKKKTMQNESFRLQNIHKKVKYSIPIIKQQSIIQKNNSDGEIINGYNSNIYDSNIYNSIYKFNQVNNFGLNINISRENETLLPIPKISFKEVPIPPYSDTDNFDMNKINQNISTQIQMDIFASDTIHDVNVNILKKKKIQKIIHVYQEKYAKDVLPTGFGDFIRGCFFIIQFCNKYGFEYEIIINHPIAEFFKKYSSNYMYNSIYKQLLNDKIFMFTDNNLAETVFDSEEKNSIERFLLIKQKFANFINYLSSLQVVNHSVFSYNILFPYDSITVEECKLVRSIFEPSIEMEHYVNRTLDLISLNKKQYIVIHIRSGDSYLKNENKLFDGVYFEIIKNEIIEIIFKNKLGKFGNFMNFGNSENFGILLIADNNEIKVLLNKEIPTIKFFINDITHLGEGVKLEREKVKNTLLDYYLMSNAVYIYSFTSYPHGSGFSYWCSKIYDIPYKCKYICVK